MYFLSSTIIWMLRAILGQFAVGPAAAGTRVKECRSAAETRNIAQKTVQIGETGFKCVAEHGNIIGVFVTQGITS